jgi:general secretion pathway protein B
MSFILDALRKSEHERQMSAGQNAGILYQVEIKRHPNPLLIPALLLIAVILVLILIWLIWPRSNQINLSNTVIQPETTKARLTQTIQQDTNPAPSTMHEKQTPTIAQKKVRISTQDINQKSSREETISGTAPSAVTISRKPAGVDPLSGLPPINVSGYVHNEQNGNLAMINNKLVHEGEEIYPGLLLIKILDNSAIFSYKGYVFTR